MFPINWSELKRMVHPKMKNCHHLLMSVQTCMRYFYFFYNNDNIILYYVEYIYIYVFFFFFKNAGNQTADHPHWLPFISLLWKSMVTNNCLVLQNYSKIIILGSTLEINLYRFVTTWGWVNNDKIANVWWTIPLN